MPLFIQTLACEQWLCCHHQELDRNHSFIVPMSFVWDTIMERVYWGNKAYVRDHGTYFDQTRLCWTLNIPTTKMALTFCLLYWSCFSLSWSASSSWSEGGAWTRPGCSSHLQASIVVLKVLPHIKCSSTIMVAGTSGAPVQFWQLSRLLLTPSPHSSIPSNFVNEILKGWNRGHQIMDTNNHWKLHEGAK